LSSSGHFDVSSGGVVDSGLMRKSTLAWSAPPFPAFSFFFFFLSARRRGGGRGVGGGRRRGAGR